MPFISVKALAVVTLTLTAAVLTAVSLLDATIHEQTKLALIASGIVMGILALAIVLFMPRATPPSRPISAATTPGMIQAGQQQTPLPYGQSIL